MFTHCPHCDTCFRVTSEQLKSAQGSVRCGRCFGTFNALDNLVDQSPSNEPPPAPPQVTAAVEPTPAMAGAGVAVASVAVPSIEEPVSIAAPVAQVKEAQAERSQQLLEEIHAEPIKSSRGSFWAWSFITLVLATVFVGQYAYFNLNSLSQNLKLRPILQTMCEVAKCEVPLMHSPHQISLVERNIRNHPTEKGILLVEAKITNKAPYTQVFPVMGLSLHNITGQTIAQRRFKPSEYLAGDYDFSKGIQSKQTVNIALELVDPGSDAVGFEFNFF